MRPDLLPTTHSRHVGRHLDDALFEDAMEAANENARASLIAGVLFLGILIALVVVAGVLGFLLGRAA